MPRVADASVRNTSSSVTQPGRETTPSRWRVTASLRSSSRHSPSPSSTKRQSRPPPPRTTRSATSSTRSTRSWRPIFPAHTTRRCPSSTSSGSGRGCTRASTGPFHTTKTRSGAAPVSRMRRSRKWLTVSVASGRPLGLPLEQGEHPFDLAHAPGVAGAEKLRHEVTLVEHDASAAGPHQPGEGEVDVRRLAELDDVDPAPDAQTHQVQRGPAEGGRELAHVAQRTGRLGSGRVLPAVGPLGDASPRWPRPAGSRRRYGSPAVGSHAHLLHQARVDAEGDVLDDNSHVPRAGHRPVPRASAPHVGVPLLPAGRVARRIGEHLVTQLSRSDTSGGEGT